MCFSATASFVAGASLFAAGVLTTKKATRKAEVPFRNTLDRGLL